MKNNNNYYYFKQRKISTTIFSFYLHRCFNSNVIIITLFQVFELNFRPLLNWSCSTTLQKGISPSGWTIFMMLLMPYLKLATCQRLGTRWWIHTPKNAEAPSLVQEATLAARPLRANQWQVYLPAILGSCVRSQCRHLLEVVVEPSLFHLRVHCLLMLCWKVMQLEVAEDRRSVCIVIAVWAWSGMYMNELTNTSWNCILQCSINNIFLATLFYSSHAHPRVRAEKKMSVREQDYQVGLKKWTFCCILEVHQSHVYFNICCCLDSSSYPGRTSVCRNPDWSSLHSECWKSKEEHNNKRTDKLPILGWGKNKKLLKKPHS